MYLLFKKITSQKLVGLEVIGTWGIFDIAYLPPDREPFFDIDDIKATILPSEGVARAFIFMGVGYRGWLNIRQNSPNNYLLPADLRMSGEADHEKVRYDLTEQNIADTVMLAKCIMRKIAQEHFDLRYKELNLEAGILETASWPTQRKEAELYRLDSTGSFPTLERLAAARSITLEEMVDKIESAIQKYEEKMGEILQNSQTIETLIRNCQNIADVNRLLHTRFGWEMPSIQREDEGITTSAKFNLTI
jgi:hypothetical protein